MFERLDWLSAKPQGEALDILYDEFDAALLDGNFVAVDLYLRHAILRKYRVETLIGFLTVTLFWKERLKERAGFYDRVEAYIEDKYPDRAEKLLQGLE